MTRLNPGNYESIVFFTGRECPPRAACRLHLYDLSVREGAEALCPAFSAASSDFLSRGLTFTLNAVLI